ncbi:MAG: peptidylprolyl isomerase [Bryobacteraceae bacterium]
MTRRLQSAFIPAVLLLSACSRSPVTEEKRTEAPAPASAGTYKVRFTTSQGPIVIEVHRDWAPIGAQRFEELVKTGFFDGARFFRIVPNFVIQFGLAGDPALTKKYDHAIADDPVKQTNRRGSLAFATAGRNTRTSQIFINIGSNQQLDDQGFAPFAMVVEGLELVDKFYRGYGEAPDQQAITSRGNAYLTQSFPNLDYIRKAEVI